MWGQLSLETVQAAREIGFRFFFASGTLLWYSWNAPKDSLQARLAAGVFYLSKSSTNCGNQAETATGQFPGRALHVHLAEGHLAWRLFGAMLGRIAPLSFPAG